MPIFPSRTCPVPMGETMAEAGSEFKIVVSLSMDATEATITVKGPEGKAVPMELMLDALKKESVTVGIMSDALMKLGAPDGPRDEEIVVAKGKPAEHGEDAVIRYLFDIDPRPRASVDKKGRANFKETGILQVVEKGELLAVKRPPTPGKPGITVSGKRISPKPGKDVFLKQGEGTVYADRERNKLIAAVNGCASLTPSQDVKVSNLYVVKSDVDYDTGNIRFDGHVRIEGDVRSGFEVEATGDIEVKGVVEDAKILAGGNLMIRGGAVGTGKGDIRAVGDLHVRFVENQKLVADGDIHVAEEIIHGDITSGRGIRVRHGKGAIIGGVVRARERVEARVFGNIHYKKTEIIAAYAPGMDEWAGDIQKALKNKDIIKDRVQAAITNLVQNKYRMGELELEQEAALQHLYMVSKDLDSILKELEENRSHIDEMREKLTKHAIVGAINTIYPGVRITIDDAKMQVDNEFENGGMFRYKGGKIQKVKA
ncbi:DUF342 domain-containing protein [bacterium]|nr:DUF342 domain-containing protein [bacterium]